MDKAAREFVLSVLELCERDLSFYGGCTVTDQPSLPPSQQASWKTDVSGVLNCIEMARRAVAGSEHVKLNGVRLVATHKELAELEKLAQHLALAKQPQQGVSATHEAVVSPDGQVALQERMLAEQIKTNELLHELITATRAHSSTDWRLP